MSPIIFSPGMQLSRNIDDYPDGILIPIDKPYRWTSADVIRKVKWSAGKFFGKKNLKVGHAGTLDPLATGILIVCIGKATKLAEELQKSPKQYIAGVSFGATTPSFDLEKDIDVRYPLDGVSEESIRGILPEFIGEQMQVAPLFSAKSVDGTRAYEMARKLLKQGNMAAGEGILQSSLIHIYGLELLSYQSPLPDSAKPMVARELVNGGTASEALRWDERSEGLAESGKGTRELANADNCKNNRINVADISGEKLVRTEILVDCSKGTYIRALARDLGEALDSGAFLHSLRRTKNGPFTIEQAVSIEDMSETFKGTVL